jgi:hypothetical protein
MLIEPASNVSVPLVVVMRIRSSVAESDLLPATDITSAALDVPNVPDAAHKFVDEFIKTIVMLPLSKTAALLSTFSGKDVVEFIAPVFLIPEPRYPVASIPPESPICINQGVDDPFVLTPFNITVIRFTHEGMLVKSTEVPLALTDVPDVSTPTPVGVPAVTGLVRVLFVSV